MRITIKGSLFTIALISGVSGFSLLSVNTALAKSTVEEKATSTTKVAVTKTNTSKTTPTKTNDIKKTSAKAQDTAKLSAAKVPTSKSATAKKTTDKTSSDKAGVKKAATDKTVTTKDKTASAKKPTQTKTKVVYPSKPDPLPEMTIGELDCTPSPVSVAFDIKHYRFAEVKPKDLAKVNGFPVHKDAAPKLRAMLAAAKKDGVVLKLGSGFRSVQYQHDIVIRKKKAKQAEKDIYYYSSPAGYSEHHTGFAVDFSPIDPRFGKDKKGKATKAYTWLQKHAQEYGFSQTYTADIAKANGIAEETWHWKFTDSPTAQAMLINASCYSAPSTTTPPAVTDNLPQSSTTTPTTEAEPVSTDTVPVPIPPVETDTNLAEPEPYVPALPYE